MQIYVLNVHADLVQSREFGFSCKFMFFTSWREEVEFKWPVKLPRDKSLGREFLSISREIEKSYKHA